MNLLKISFAYIYHLTTLIYTLDLSFTIKFFKAFNLIITNNSGRQTHLYKKKMLFINSYVLCEFASPISIMKKQHYFLSLVTHATVQFMQISLITSQTTKNNY